MSVRTVTNQAELDQALTEKVEWIDIKSPQGVWLEVRACDSATVRACDSATVTAYGSATVTAYGSATVTAYDSATVTACDSATVRAYDSATVTAYDSATVTACDSATVRAYDSATVRAYGSATVRAYGSVSVHLHSATVNVSGGVILDHTKDADMTPQEWCKYHGVKVSRGIATLYKAVNDHWSTARGTDYSPGSKPACDDWEDGNDCGGGLHFGPTPTHALAYHMDATRFVAVGVKVSDIRVIPYGTAKCKAPSVVRACVEVDIDGQEVPA